MIHEDKPRPDNTGQKQRGRFPPGKSGNPSGRPLGSRHKATLAIEALLEGEAEKLGRKAIELALAGDIAALRLCLERVAPPRKGRTVSFAMPKVETSQDVLKALQALMDAVSTGDLTPDEAVAVSSILETKRRAIEIVDLEARLTKLEEKNGK